MHNGTLKSLLLILPLALTASTSAVQALDNISINQLAQLSDYQVNQVLISEAAKKPEPTKKTEPAKQSAKDGKKDVKKELQKDTKKDKAKPLDDASKKDKDKDKDKKAKKEEAEEDFKEPVITDAVNVDTLILVGDPKKYLGKNIKFKSDFFAFSNLALNYKPAFRSQKKYISFLVYRPKSKVPFSELKLAMMIPKEKDPRNKMLTSLQDGDTVEVTGKVFSTALDEPWIDVLNLKKIASVKKDKDKDENDSDSTD